MRILIILLLFFSSIYSVYSQDIQSALFHFENFEYEKALNDFEKSSKLNELKFENSEKMAYCYYITRNNTKGLPYIQSFIEQNESSPHLWLWKGTLEKESGAYEAAISSFKTFQSKGTELNVDVLIESCNQIENWKTHEDYEIENMAINDQKANSFEVFDGKDLVYYELGLDSLKNDLSISTNNETFSQLLLMRPFLNEGNTPKSIALFDNYGELSINSMTLDKSEAKIYFSAIDALNDKNILRSSQIYIADYTSLETPLENASLWKYNGMLDTSSCSHPTISNDGVQMIFSKMSKKTNGSDLYISKKEGSTWSEPTPLENLNSNGNEMYPSFNGDSLFSFSSDGRPGYGGLDLYSVKAKTLTETEDIYHFKSPVNSFMDDFNYRWYNDSIAQFVSNRKNGVGDDDVWLVDIEMPIVVPPVVDDGFKTWYDAWNLKQIYFDFDSFESLVNHEFIEGYKKYHDRYKLDLELVGHTDSRGSIKYNLELGMNRAEWMREQLITAKLGNSISIQSVGDTELVNDCSPGKLCSEDDHRLNRFVEIKLTIGVETVD